MKKITVGENDAGQRLDRFLRKYLRNASLSHIYKMIRKDVKVNGRRAGQKTFLNAGDEITLYISDDEFAGFIGNGRNSRKTAPRRTFKIIYEDENVLIVNKPAGLLVHGDGREKKDTLVNQVTDYLTARGSYDPGREKTFRPAAANRLDRGTSGLVMFGVNAGALRALTAMMRERDMVEKHYLTIVSGDFKEHRMLRGLAVKDEKKNMVSVDMYGKEGPAGRKNANSSGKGREIETEVTPIARAESMTLLDVHLITGRTHQIRAHLSAAGYPVAGDMKYGNRALNKRLADRYGLRSQFLHAYKLIINDAYAPLEYLRGKSFTDPLPKKLAGMKGEIFR